MKKEDLYSLKPLVKLGPLIEKAGHKKKSLFRVISGHRPRDLYPEEERDLRRALLDLRDDIDEVAGP